MEEYENKAIVVALYRSLTHGDTESMGKLIASDLEWWFHGPPERHHMMRVLTGDTTHPSGFKFEPKSIVAIKDLVIAEGWEGKAYWVHVWTVKGGIIMKFREYFNTLLTVRHLRRINGNARPDNLTPWRSQLPGDAHQRCSLPELVLTV